MDPIKREMGGGRVCVCVCARACSRVCIIHSTPHFWDSTSYDDADGSPAAGLRPGHRPEDWEICCITKLDFMDL